MADSGNENRITPLRRRKEKEKRTMCKISAAQIQADGKAVGTAIDNLGAALQATDPTLATNLETAGNALIAVTANWQTGSAMSILTDAEQAVIVVLNLIPLTSPYAALAAIVFTALNLLIANAQTQTTQTGNMVSDAHKLLAAAAALNTGSQWAGKAVIKHHLGNDPRKDFESAWNVAAKPLGVGLVTL
jgi:hypothetical protein